MSKFEIEYDQINLCNNINCLIMFNTSEQVVDSSSPPTFELQYLVRQPKIFTVYPPVLFLFHGAGSSEQDLFSFASELPDEWLVISARAPYTVSKGHYKWYDVKMIDQKIAINFRQEEESRKKILRFIDDIISFYHADSSRVVLAGFSQGANMASAVSLTSPEKVAGFAVFSGRFIEEIRPLILKSDSLKHLKSFLAHGSKDHRLPIMYAEENRQTLQSLGIQVTFSLDAVSHSISPKQFADFLVWLIQI